MDELAGVDDALVTAAEIVEEVFKVTTLSDIKAKPSPNNLTTQSDMRERTQRSTLTTAPAGAIDAAGGR